MARHSNLAAEWFRRAAGSGNTREPGELAKFLLNGAGPSEDQIRTRRWFKQAAESGDLVAAFNFSVCLAEGVRVDRDDRKAAAWMRRAADGVIGAQ